MRIILHFGETNNEIIKGCIKKNDQSNQLGILDGRPILKLL